MYKIKSILGVAVALAMTAAGAFAGPNPQTIQVSSYPAVLDQPNTIYVFHAPNANSDNVCYGDPAVIWVKASGVTVNLNGVTIHTAGNGILIGPKPGDVGPVVQGVTITGGPNGATIDGKNQQASTYFGFVIGVTSKFVSFDHVSFTGGFGYNADYGSGSNVSNGTILGMFNIGSQGYLPTLVAGLPQLDPLFPAGGGTYANLTVAANSQSPWTGTPLVVTLPQTRTKPNVFTSVVAVGGTPPQLASGDVFNGVVTP